MGRYEYEYVHKASTELKLHLGRKRAKRIGMVNWDEAGGGGE